MRRSANRALVVVFVAAVTLPIAATLAGVEGADPKAENREMAAFPQWGWSWKSATAYPAGFARWFDDHFAFRSSLVRWDGELRLFALRASPSSSVIVGRSGWLFYGDDGAAEDIAKNPPLGDDALKNWRDSILRARDWLRERKIAFVFAIAPDKHVIYPEYLPDSVRPVGSRSRQDQVFAALQDSGVTLDPRPALLSAKSQVRIYHVTDTHWNERGAYIAYRLIVDAVRQQTAAVPPAWPESDFQLVTRVTEAGDLAGMLGLKRALREERLMMVPRRPRAARVVEPSGGSPTDEEGTLITEIPGSTLPRAVIFRDSFVSPLVPFLSEHFSRAVYLWQKDFVPEQVQAEHPDVVIYEMIGRRLYNFIPSPELIQN